MQEQTLVKLKQIKARYDELQTEMASPEVLQDQEKYLKIVKEAADLAELVEVFDSYEGCTAALAENKALLEETPSAESELVSLIREEISELSEREEGLERDLLRLLQPKDPRDERDVIMEIRGGAGGEVKGRSAT